MLPTPRLAPRLIASLLVASLVATPGLAHARRKKPRPPAAAPAPVDPADALLDEGTSLFTLQADYDGALQRFQQSYDLRPGWKALNGMALVYQQQGKYVEAIESYERLLGEFGATLNEGQLATVRRRVGELEARVGVAVLTLVQDGTFVTIDGREIKRTGAETRVRLLPGRHTLVATLDGHETLSLRIDARAGVATPVAVELAAERVKVVERPVRFERRYPTWVPWAMLGGGVALAVGGGALHYSGVQDIDAFDRLVANRVPVGSAPVAVPESLRRSGEVKQVAAVSLYAVGGAALVTGLVLVYFNRPHPVEGPARTTRVFFGGTSVGVVVDF